MGNPEYFRQCNGKSCHSKSEANRAKQRVGTGRGKDVRIYFCQECHFYHLTKKENDIKFQNQRKMSRMQEDKMVHRKKTNISAYWINSEESGDDVW